MGAGRSQPAQGSGAGPARPAAPQRAESWHAAMRKSVRRSVRAPAARLSTRKSQRAPPVVIDLGDEGPSEPSVARGKGPMRFDDRDVPQMASGRMSLRKSLSQPTVTARKRSSKPQRVDYYFVGTEEDADPPAPPSADPPTPPLDDSPGGDAVAAGRPAQLRRAKSYNQGDSFTPRRPTTSERIQFRNLSCTGPRPHPGPSAPSLASRQAAGAGAASQGNSMSMAARAAQARKASRTAPTRRPLQTHAQSAAASKTLPASRAAASNVNTDETFVDYTVVPLLLRSGLSYVVAERFGRHLKHVRNHAELMAILAGPDQLLQALADEDIATTATFAERLRTDEFWTQARGSGSTARVNNRKSFLYFRSDPNARRSFRPKELKDQMTAPAVVDSTKRRSQFRPVRVEGQAPELSSDELAKFTALANRNGISTARSGSLTTFYTA